MSITRIVRMFRTRNNTIVKALVYSAVCVIGAALLVSCSATGAGDDILGAVTGDPGPVTSEVVLPTITLSPPSTTIIDVGTAVVITVAANSAPSDDVTIVVTATQDGATVGTPQSVTLTKSEYSQPATFTGLTAGLHTFTATTAPSGIMNPTIESLEITMNDPAQPVVTLSSSSLTIDEVVVTVAALSAPLADVTIEVTATQDGEPVATERVTLTSSEFRKQVTFTGLTAGLHTFTATAASFDIVQPTIVPLEKITIHDPGRPVVTVTTTTPVLAVGSDAVITVAVVSAPTDGVTITVSAKTGGADGTEVATQAVTFDENSSADTPGNLLEQTATFSGLGAETYTFTATATLTDTGDATALVVISGVPPTIAVNDLTMPTVTVTPMVTENDVSVAVAVTDLLLGAEELITLTLTGGPSTKEPVTVTLPNGADASAAAKTTEFSDLKPGGYTITATAAPSNINIAYAENEQMVTIVPQVTITTELVGDDLVVTAAVTDGPIGAAPVRIELSVSPGGGSKTGRITLPAGASEGKTYTKVFEGLPSGRHIISATVADTSAGTVRLAEVQELEADVTVAPKVTLSLAAGDSAGTVRARAHIDEGTLEGSGVVITAVLLDGLGTASATEALPELSGSSGAVQEVMVTGLQSGVWVLDENRIAEPAGIILTVDTTSVIIDPQVTLTHELVGDDLIVTAGVTDGPIGTAAVRIRLSVGGTAPEQEYHHIGAGE